MLTATFRLSEPDKMSATMQITMTVKEWKELRALISDEYPGWQLNGAITDLIHQAEKVFFSEHKYR
jgi:hypothetical protein